MPMYQDLRLAGYLPNNMVNNSVGNLVSYPSEIPHVLNVSPYVLPYQGLSPAEMMSYIADLHRRTEELKNSATRRPGTTRGGSAGTTTPPAASGQPTAGATPAPATTITADTVPSHATPATAPASPSVSDKDVRQLSVDHDIIDAVRLANLKARYEDQYRRASLAQAATGGVGPGTYPTLLSPSRSTLAQEMAAQPQTVQARVPLDNPVKPEMTITTVNPVLDADLAEAQRFEAWRNARFEDARNRALLDGQTQPGEWDNAGGLADVMVGPPAPLVLQPDAEPMYTPEAEREYAAMLRRVYDDFQRGQYPGVSAAPTAELLELPASMARPSAVALPAPQEAVVLPSILTPQDQPEAVALPAEAPAAPSLSDVYAWGNQYLPESLPSMQDILDWIDRYQREVARIQALQRAASLYPTTNVSLQ